MLTCLIVQEEVVVTKLNVRKVLESENEIRRIIIFHIGTAPFTSLLSF